MGRSGVETGKRSRRKWPIIVAVLAVLVVAGVGVWYFVIREDAPEKANLDDASRTLDSVAGSDSPSTPGELAGEWSVDTSVGSFDNFSGTWAGYRFDEELAAIGSTTAVGRTPEVSGTMTVAEDEVSAVQIEADLTKLQSDQGFRDEAIRTRGLQSNDFPTGTFELTKPIKVPDGITDGKRVQSTATGDLTIHGVTNEVTVDIEAELTGDHAVVVGSAPVAMDDFGMEPPEGARVLSVSNEGEFEFQLFLTKS